MPVVATLWRMVALHLVRSPVVLALLPLGLVAVPVLLELRPLNTPVGALELVRSWCFPAGLVGATLAVSLLARREAFLQRVSPLERALGEWGGCLLATLLLQLPILLGGLPGAPEALDLARALTDILCSDLHLAGLALLSLALPISPSGRLLAFLALAWALPALAGPSAPLARLANLLDASRPLAAGTPALPALVAGLGLALLHVLRRLPAAAPR